MTKCADSRLGKTIACEQYIWNYAEAHGGRYLSWEPKLVKQNERDAVAGVTVAEVTVDGEVTRPIVMVQIGVSPTYQGVMRDLIFSVAGHAPPRTTNNLALVQILTRILGQLGTQLLIFDESQRIAQSMNGGVRHASRPKVVTTNSGGTYPSWIAVRSMAWNSQVAAAAAEF